MRPKEIQKKLGINADRIKLFKREGVFTPENPPSGNRGTDYTESDFKNLQFLVVLTKMGLTCSDIRKMQEGDCTLEEAVNYRKNQIEADMEKKRNALTLLSDLLQNQEQFETFHTEHYWDIITERESKGEEFIDVEDMYGYSSVSLIRTVKCPYCGDESEIDLEDYETGTSSYDNEIGMGEDTMLLRVTKGRFNDPEYDNDLSALLKLPAGDQELFHAVKEAGAASPEECAFTAVDCAIPRLTEKITDELEAATPADYAKAELAKCSIPLKEELFSGDAALHHYGEKLMEHNLASATDYGILVSQNGQTVEQCLNRPGPQMEMR